MACCNPLLLTFLVKLVTFITCYPSYFFPLGIIMIITILSLHLCLVPSMLEICNPARSWWLVSCLVPLACLLLLVNTFPLKF